MLTIDWKPGNALSVLGLLRDGRLAMKAANAAAKEYRADILGYVEEGKAFANRGKHQKHIRWRTDGPGARVYVRARHLVWMEQGTGAHTIGPKRRRKGGSVRFKAGGGGFLFRKLVSHPGTRPMPFFFADFASREEKMRAAAAGVLAAKLGARR